MPDATASFDRWADAARPGLLRLARSWVKDRAEAEDVVQLTLEGVWRAWKKGGLEDLDAYARRAVWVNARKRKARWKDWTPLEEAHWAASAPAEARLEPWELERALARLPAAQQTVLRLRYYGGLSLDETAQALKLSINTVASRCRYAFGALRQALHTQEEGHGKGGTTQR